MPPEVKTVTILVQGCNDSVIRNNRLITTEYTTALSLSNFKHSNAFSVFLASENLLACMIGTAFTD